MPRLISCAHTIPAILDQTKTVTRRLGWWQDRNGRRLVVPGDRLTLCGQIMGRKPGQDIVRYATVPIIDVRRGPLDAITDTDVYREGVVDQVMSEWWAAHPATPPPPIRTRFVWWYCDTFDCTPRTDVTRVGAASASKGVSGGDSGNPNKERMSANPAGAPPLDYWVIPTQPYSGKTSTARRVPCGPDDGGERTASPDCPVHGGRPDLPPTAQRDGRASSPRSRTPRSDAGPVQVQLLGSEANDESPDRAGSSPSPTTGTTGPECAPAAKPRSKASSKTAPAPATTTPGTPCGETPIRTGGTSAPPSSDVHHPGTSGSRTSEGDSLGSPKPRTSAGTADTGTQPESSSACTCSFHRVVTESTSHYAVYPPALCERPIESMVPRKVCTGCGEPSRRIVEVTGLVDRDGRQVDRENWTSGIAEGKAAHSNKTTSGTTTTTTVGWTDCGHGSYRNGVVLDPFAGSGTTLMVASGHGRDSIGIDLDERNAELARDRVGPLLLEVVDMRERAAS